MDQYPRLRITAAQLVLFAHVMISTTAVKPHKYSLTSNVQSEGGVNGKWTENYSCKDCVTSSMSEAQKNAKKKLRNCRHKNQTLSLVAHKECSNDCMIWNCLSLNCDQFKFDPKKPITCSDCSKEPTITHDCGCKKWTCEKRRCVGEEYNVIEKCPDECSVPVTTEECGCTTYSCEYDKPPPSQCNTGPGCNEYEICEPKLCPKIEEITCNDCQEIDLVEEECGCHKYTCKPVECIKDEPCQSALSHTHFLTHTHTHRSIYGRIPRSVQL